jgi:hypothetical protein
MTALTLRRRTLLATAVAALWLAGAAGACAGADPVDLQVVERETGRPLQVWRHHGRLFVAGQPGAHYALRVTNRTHGRVMVVLSVDGVNVVTGQTAGYDQNGYVLDAYQNYDVTGWRKSQVDVAAFAFAPLSQSYAARTGRPADVGVIGMAVFREKVVVPEPEPAPPPIPEARNEAGGDNVSEVVVTGARRASQPPPAAAPAQKARGAYALRDDQRLGTAHGEREQSFVNFTSFERATVHPEIVRRIEYDTYAHLAAAGVIPRPWSRPPRPEPFPMTPDGEGFVPDPPG